MALDELVKCAQNRTNFHMDKRVHIHQLTKLLALSQDEYNDPSWNCIIVPHRKICRLIRSQTDLRSDCKGEFMALILTRTSSQPTLTHTSLRNKIRKAPPEASRISTWITKMIYIARGMGLLVKPIFRFDPSIIQSAMDITPEHNIILILLVGYPEEIYSEQSEVFPGYIHFHTSKHNMIQETIH